MLRIRPPVPLTAAVVLFAITLRGHDHSAPVLAPAIAIDDSVTMEMRSATTEREPSAPPRPHVKRWRLRCTTGPYRWIECVVRGRSTDYAHLALDCTTEIGRLGISDYAWDGDKLVVYGWGANDVLGCNAAQHTTRFRSGDTWCVDNAFDARSALNICPPHVVETLCVSASRGLVGYRTWADPPGEMRCGEVPDDAFPHLERA